MTFFLSAFQTYGDFRIFVTRMEEVSYSCQTHFVNFRLHQWSFFPSNVTPCQQLYILVFQGLSYSSTSLPCSLAEYPFSSKRLPPANILDQGGLQ